MVQKAHVLGLTLGIALISVLIYAFMKIERVSINQVYQAQIVLGRSLYAAYCAQCHGKNLEGQPDWQTRLPSGRLPAPPHDASGHTWHHPDKVLIGITKHGLKPYTAEDYESDMPAFANVLSDQDITAIFTFIKSTWPERQREYQERITARAKTK